MKLKFLLLICTCLSSLSLFAQNNYTVKGNVIDTGANNAKLVNASVAVLAAKDSLLVKYTRVTPGGEFAMDNLSKGKFILLVTYPGYADYVERFSIDSVKNTHDFGRIGLLLKSKVLAEVIIKAKAAAMKIKGDTTEYNAAAFDIQPNSKVEDLLKQLPGIQVDKDGKITAQGQTVSKVLVDGEEFFGDDPTLVTKNIRGDMVDKVQLYDKTSDQAAFTGIDDGKKTKTINIKLKEDKKNGYFGKVDAGVGTDGYYQSQLLFNTFKGKKKFSAYGTLANTGKTGLGWEDNQKYGSSDNLQFGDSGEVYISGGSGDELDSFWGYYDGKGIPVARSGGLHFDNKWNSDKESINTNYKIGSIGVDGTENILSQSNLPSQIFNTNSDQKSHKYVFRQKLDATYQLKLDTSSNLKISAEGTGKHFQTNNDYLSTSTREDGSLLNNNQRNITNEGDQQVFNASAFYTKKFKKKGRTFSLNVNEAYNHNDSKGYLNSELDFYNKQGGLDSTQRIDQYKTSNIKASVFTSNATYTEPLSKPLSVVFNYALGLNNSTADRKSFDKSASGQYDLLDSTLSNNYRLNQFSNQVGAVFNYLKNKTTINFGTKVSDVNFNQTNEYTGIVLKRNFINWNPQASFLYKFSQQKSFRVSYNGNTTQPTIDQIQPVRVNTDPLNIVLGNPTLRPSFNNRLSAQYNSYRVITDQWVSMYGSFNYTINPIVNSTFTDSTGKSTLVAINLPDKKPSSYYFGMNLNRKIIGDFQVGLGINSDGNTYYNMINTKLNKTKSYNYSGRISLSKYKQKKYDFWTSAGPTYGINESSLQPEFNSNGYGFNANGGFTVYLPAKFQIHSDANYQYNAPTKTFNQDFRRTIVNANIAKTFFKGESLKLMISGNDLLNQNVGFTRSATSNVITQDRYTTIKRYFMFSIVWDFNKMGGGRSAKK